MSVYPVMRFIGLGTCCECPDSWWCPVTGWTELGSSQARHLAGQGHPSSGVLMAPPRRFLPVPSPPPSSELKIAVWSLFLIFKERVDKCFIYSGFLHTWWSFGSSKPTSFVTTWETVMSGLFFFPPSPALVTNSLCFSNSISSMDFPVFYTSSLSTPTPKCAVSAWSDPGTPHPSILCALTDVPTCGCTHTQGGKMESSYTYYLIDLILTWVISLGHTGYYVILVTLWCWDVNAPEYCVSRKDEPSAAAPRQLLVPWPYPSRRCSLSMQGFHVSVTVSTPQFSPADPQLWHVTSEYTVVSLSSWLSQCPLCESKWKGIAQFGGGCLIFHWG